MKRVYCFFIALGLHLSLYSWSWLYKMEPIGFTGSTYEVEKRVASPFSQLIFSWNALRFQGYFSFWVQVRDTITKRWYDWHQAALWGTDKRGNKIQRSLQSARKWGTKYQYVRLELPKGRGADSFRLRIRAYEGATIHDIKRITVNTVHLQQFTSEVGSQALKGLSSVYIATVPLYSQMALKHPKPRLLCSPTSTTMLVSYLLKKNLDPRVIAQGVYDHGLGAYGSWPFNVAHAFEVCGGRMAFHVERLPSFKELHRYLMKGMPVVVSVRGFLKGAPQPYPSGHLLIVVGYSKRFNKVLCQDPAFGSDEKTQVAYDLKHFLTAWERSYRLAYVATRV